MIKMDAFNILGRKNLPKLSIGFHATCLFHHIQTFIIIESLDLSKGKTTMDIGHSKYFFLSSWNFAFQIIYLIIAMSCDIYTLLKEREPMPASTNKFFEKLSSFKISVFWTLVYPVTVLVFSCFWITFYLNRELIMPVEWDRVVPKFLNNAIHLNILPLVIVEMLFVSQQISHNSKKKRLILSSVYVSYIACIILVYLFSGKWVYPLLRDLQWGNKIGMFLMMYTFLNVIFSAGFHINKFCFNLLWKKYEKFQQM